MRWSIAGTILNKDCVFSCGFDEPRPFAIHLDEDVVTEESGIDRGEDLSLALDEEGVDIEDLLQVSLHSAGIVLDFAPGGLDSMKFDDDLGSCGHIRVDPKVDGTEYR